MTNRDYVVNMNDDARMSILLGEMAADSMAKKESDEEWRDRLVHLRNLVDRKVKDLDE